MKTKDEDPQPAKDKNIETIKSRAPSRRTARAPPPHPNNINPSLIQLSTTSIHHHSLHRFPSSQTKKSIPDSHPPQPNFINPFTTNHLFKPDGNRLEKPRTTQTQTPSITHQSVDRKSPTHSHPPPLTQQSTPITRSPEPPPINHHSSAATTPEARRRLRTEEIAAED
ncbi:hypothetical protein Drorol1_Dr00005420 [Drosera rotundifolia]